MVSSTAGSPALTSEMVRVRVFAGNSRSPQGPFVAATTQRGDFHPGCGRPRTASTCTLREITERLQDRGSGVLFDAYYCCTHKPCQGCECRKPRPGLLHKTASDLNIDLARSIFI